MTEFNAQAAHAALVAAGTDPYEASCRVAATEQGLGPLLMRLDMAKTEHVLEQTGGMVMAVSVALANGRTHLVATNDGEWVVALFKHNTWIDGADEADCEWTGLDVEQVATMMTTKRCADHRAYDADYCPSCGTARQIGG